VLAVELILFGTTTLQLADGSLSYRITAYGQATIGSETKGNVIVLETGTNEVSLGMESLRRFDKMLVVAPPDPVVLLDRSTPNAPATPSPATTN
jgi:hypothetical protein